MSAKLSEDDLSFLPFIEKDDISTLDCREPDNSDPLGVHEFVHKHAIKSHNSKLSALYVVRYKDRIIACFTLSMFLITSKRLVDEDQIKDLPIKQYPAVLLGQMCVDKEYRNRDIGKYICKFSLGVASFVSKRVGCMCLLAHTNNIKQDYYIKKCGFSKAKEESTDKMVWLYKRMV